MSRFEFVAGGARASAITFPRRVSSGKDAPAVEREDKGKENLTIESGGRGRLSFPLAAEIAQNRC